MNNESNEMDYFSMPKNTVIVDGTDLLSKRHMLTPPHITTIIINPQNAEIVWSILSQEYPQTHPIFFIKQCDEKLDEIPSTLSDLKSNASIFDNVKALKIPPYSDESSFEYFQNVVAILRGLNGCPWDKKQTHQSLREDFIQEAYELIEALDTNDLDEIKEELGDVLLHVVLQAQIAKDQNEFSMGDVIAGISEKMIFRHEHIFSTHENLTADEVLNRWEKMKKKEREKNHSSQGLLDGVPKSGPALSTCFAYQKRAARAGFDWNDRDGVLKALFSEIDEFQSADSGKEQEEELGDILFSVVNLARWYKIDPETALRSSNRKFFNRVHYVEKRAGEINKDLFEMPIEEKDIYWNEYKEKYEK